MSARHPSPAGPCPEQPYLELHFRFHHAYHRRHRKQEFREPHLYNSQFCFQVWNFCRCSNFFCVPRRRRLLLPCSSGTAPGTQVCSVLGSAQVSFVLQRYFGNGDKMYVLHRKYRASLDGQECVTRLIIPIHFR
jgi:hypothetical protein